MCLTGWQLALGCFVISVFSMGFVFDVFSMVWLDGEPDRGVPL